MNDNNEVIGDQDQNNDDEHIINGDAKQNNTASSTADVDDSNGDIEKTPHSQP